MFLKWAAVQFSLEHNNHINPFVVASAIVSIFHLVITSSIDAMPELFYQVFDHLASREQHMNMKLV
jgi:hypothetical protein